MATILKIVEKELRKESNSKFVINVVPMNTIWPIVFLRMKEHPSLNVFYVENKDM